MLANMVELFPTLRLFLVYSISRLDLSVSGTEKGSTHARAVTALWISFPFLTIVNGKWRAIPIST